ncbi:DUF2273 domain-containing protein [Enterococcus sp. BWM-S5]|uniref:DUF2273 domain-containing protein n=1 Tax=Enterococcus larvae TaxID=2794352 RepID=A0ABS4CJB6_9ENTE|nr:DUF2273 domain-containing protein [Enterococcus larvae]MBP1046710.1 DUF2273 domain-containing protein [Enterococcus larvae]
MKEIFEKYRWSIIGGLSGFILAILFLTVGFFKTLLILILTAAGVYVGFYLKRSGLAEHFFDDKS